MAIFKKSDDQGQPETKAVPTIGRGRPADSNHKSVIGPTLVFKGKFSADEDLIIEGQIEGSIAHHDKHLTIGRQGRVTADIHAASVIVFGKLVGDIHSEGTVSLAKGCDVEGNIYCSRIAIEDGARFTGELDMSDTPKIAAVPNELALADVVREEVRREAAKPTAKASVY